MTDFADTVRRHMKQRDMSLRRLAVAAHYDAGLLSKVLNGHRPHSAYLAARLDDALGAGGEIMAVSENQLPLRPGRPAAAAGRGASRAVAAIRVAMTGQAGAADFAAGSLAELVTHYARAAAVEPSAAVYDELLCARSLAGTLLARAAPPARQELGGTTGWLSSLLAVLATDLGDHAAALMWCRDAERHATEAGNREVAGWAALTRSLIAWYQGDPARSAAAARRGRAEGQPGTAAYAKLAAQEMRCLAQLGDAAGMREARHRAAAAMARLSPAAATTGVYSLHAAEDPPYTATSLLLAGCHAEAAEMTRGIIDAVYQPKSRAPGDHPTNYARTLLILGLAAAGAGELDEAAAAGVAALECGRIVWPTLVLAGRLSWSLQQKSPRSSQAASFRARYVEAHAGLDLARGRQVRRETRTGNADE